MNLGTFCVLTIVVTIVGIILWSMRTKRKKGGSSCSCGCSSCVFSESCHKAK